jgi:hypothetical protein
VVAPREGIFPNFDDALTELHLGQFVASEKCMSGDRRDGGNNPNADYILRYSISCFSHVDEDLSIGVIARQNIMVEC